jgi:hypothetical protein
MAVEDKFVNALVAAGKKAAAIFAGGANLKIIAWNFEVAAADSDASVYRVGRIQANAIPILSHVYADAITGGTDWDLGLYKPGVGGAVVDKDLLADGLDPASGEAITAPLNGLTNLGGADPVGNFGKPLWELLGLSAPNRQDYDLAWTANTVGSGAGTMSGFLIYADSGV